MRLRLPSPPPWGRGLSLNPAADDVLGRPAGLGALGPFGLDAGRAAGVVGGEGRAFAGRFAPVLLRIVPLAEIMDVEAGRRLGRHGVVEGRFAVELVAGEVAPLVLEVLTRRRLAVRLLARHLRAVRRHGVRSGA